MNCALIVLEYKRTICKELKIEFLTIVDFNLVCFKFFLRTLQHFKCHFVVIGFQIVYFSHLKIFNSWGGGGHIYFIPSFLSSPM
jgi:hypothetical protein